MNDKDTSRGLQALGLIIAFTGLIISTFGVATKNVISGVFFGGIVLMVIGAVLVILGRE